VALLLRIQEVHGSKLGTETVQPRSGCSRIFSVHQGNLQASTSNQASHHFHLKTDTDLVSETLCSVRNTRRRAKSKIPVIYVCNTQSSEPLQLFQFGSLKRKQSFRNLMVKSSLRYGTQRGRGEGRGNCWIRPTANCTVMTGISRDVEICVMTVKVNVARKRQWISSILTRLTGASKRLPNHHGARI
jgi:hypothetical protein